MQKDSDERTGRVDDPLVPRALRQTRSRKPFPEFLSRDENRLKSAGTVPQRVPGYPLCG